MILSIYLIFFYHVALISWSYYDPSFQYQLELVETLHIDLSKATGERSHMDLTFFFSVVEQCPGVSFVCV